MQHDRERVGETREWLVKSLGDLDAARVLLTAEPSLPQGAVFHCQQAAEKALKALLFWHDVPFRRTHNLRELAGECVRLDATLEPLLRRAAPLTAYAWLYRYPGLAPELRLDEAATALALARELYDAILTRLPEEVRP